MTAVAGFAVHRGQITFDALNTDSRELERGRIAPADRAAVSAWYRRTAGT